MVIIPAMQNQVIITKQREIYSVSQLNQTARLLLEGQFPLIWVEGEISNCARPASGHLYFSLKDEKAAVRCAMFRMRNQLLNFTPENGMQVLIRAKVSLYEGRGDYQLIAEHMELSGDGALRRAFEQLKQQLATEGAFDEARKRAIPALPKCIGVITSATGAAVHDIITVLSNRFPAIPVIIYPTDVQGKKAAGKIARAIEVANQHAHCDVIILGRGGGSLEDLWAFNEEVVARAIISSDIPIVSGIGHEVDITIADFVADLRAATPSAAAERITPDRAAMLRQIQQLQTRLIQAIERIFNNCQLQFKHIRQRLQHPTQYLLQLSQQCDFLEKQCILAMQRILEKKQQQFAGLMRSLDMVSPLATLHRGYAIVSDAKGHIICQTDQVKIGDTLQTQLVDGQFTCEVTEK